MDGGKCRLGGPPAVESLEDVEPDCACIGYLPANTTWDVPPRAPAPDEPDESHPPIQLERTRRKKAALQGWQDPSPRDLPIPDVTSATKGWILPRFRVKACHYWLG